MKALFWSNNKQTMIIILSPAKRMNYEEQGVKKHTLPQYLDHSGLVAKKMKQLSVGELEKLMKISKDLAELNYERYQEWKPIMELPEAKQSVLAFRGDAYLGMEVDTLKAKDLDFANKHLRILSGLYGLLRPTDLIRPYRLEMGTKIGVGKKKNLYEFWTEILTGDLCQLLDKTKSKTLVNLASNEYFKAIDTSQIKKPIITPIFKDRKGDNYKVLFAYAKKARGAMTRFAIDKRMEDPEGLKSFDWDGYYYNKKMSSETDWVFTRG